MSDIGDYLAILPIVAGRGWAIRKERLWHGSIRDAAGRCPLCALANEIDPSIEEKHDFLYALGRCGLSGEDSRDIADAADYRGHPLRPTLMSALGMRSTT